MYVGRLKRYKGIGLAIQALALARKTRPDLRLDIAGTGIGSPQTDINKSWASGWGVRLLETFLAEHYER